MRLRGSGALSWKAGRLAAHHNLKLLPSAAQIPTKGVVKLLFDFGQLSFPLLPEQKVASNLFLRP
jgi:hypothetical protein